jgi:hypothetical protein
MKNNNNKLTKAKTKAHIKMSNSFNEIMGELIRANEVLKEIALNSNLRPIREIKNKLSESSRMFNPKFTNKDKLEYIMFFKNLK